MELLRGLWVGVCKVEGTVALYKGSLGFGAETTRRSGEYTWGGGGCYPKPDHTRSAGQKAEDPED